jgi:hypothetical protein
MILLTAIAGGLYGDQSSIGMAAAAGSFWADSAGVAGHATVFEGSTIESGETPVKLQIEGGVRILLDVHSRAQVYGNRLTLERGRAQLESGKDYRIEAGTMRIAPAKAQSRAIVAIGISNVVEVAALGGAVRVRNADGVAVANVAAGRSLEFRLGQGREQAMLTGCVAKADRAYLLRDEVSEITVELRGPEVANQVGQRVEVAGTVAPSLHAVAPAEQVVQANTIKVLGNGCGAAAVAASGSRARSAADGGGMVRASPSSGGASTAVIAGIAIAAAAGVATGVVVTQLHHQAPISGGR